jgi:hypothetical protein
MARRRTSSSRTSPWCPAVTRSSKGPNGGAVTLQWRQQSKHRSLGEIPLRGFVTGSRLPSPGYKTARREETQGGSPRSRSSHHSRSTCHCPVPWQGTGGGLRRVTAGELRLSPWASVVRPRPSVGESPPYPSSLPPSYSLANCRNGVAKPLGPLPDHGASAVRRVPGPALAVGQNWLGVRFREASIVCVAS